MSDKLKKIDPFVLPVFVLLVVLAFVAGLLRGGR